MLYTVSETATPKDELLRQIGVCKIPIKGQFNSKSHSESANHFYQGGAVMKQTNLKYEISKKALSNLTNNKSIATYKRAIRKFILWAKENNLGRPDKIQGIEKEVLQQYTDYLYSNTAYTPETIHGYITPIAKGLDISLSAINKPKRTAGSISRSRNRFANKQGKKELEMEQFKNIVNFQRAVGIRRDELAHLKGSDYLISKSGVLYVIVRKGKGGKKQYQRILPQYKKFVLSVFENTKKDELLFSKEELNNHIDFHALRAELAREAYDYYSKNILNSEQFKNNLIKVLYSRFNSDHSNDSKTSRKKAFEETINHCEIPVKLRGENKDRALSSKRPIEYNRLALLAVSVLHLSHWRIDVTTRNYMC